MQSTFSFDLQLFAKAKTLSDPLIQELSMIFEQHKGQEWAPRNPGAVVLGLKGSPATTPAAPAWMDRFVSALKGRSSKGWLVSDDADDNVDGDGDASDDYERLVSLIGTTNYDVGSAMGISDPDARSIAITTALDNFKKNIDDVYAGGDGTAAWKAGARHSKADSDHIAAIGANADKMASHADKMAKIASDTKDHVDALSTPVKKDGDPDEGGDDDASKAAAKAAADAAGAVAVAKGAAAGNETDTLTVQVVGDGAAAVVTADAIAASVVAATETALKSALLEQAATLKAEFAAALAETTSALKADFDAQIAAAKAETVEKATAAVEQTDILKASVDAIVGAARRPRAPGGFAAMEPNGTSRKAAALNANGGDYEVPAIDPNTPASSAIQTLLKAQTG